MRISAQKLNAAIANCSRAYYISLPEAEWLKLRQEGGLVDCNTAFYLGAALGVNPRSLLATKADVEEYNRRSSYSTSS